MCTRVSAGLGSVLLIVMAACGESPGLSEHQTPSSADSRALEAPPVSESTSVQLPPSAGPAPNPAGGLRAESADVEGTLTVTIKWSATIVTGIPAEGLTTTVYERRAELACPVISSDETTASYFAAIDDPNGDPMAATASYQPWWNEDCSGSLTINDTYHADDPTLAGPEPVVRTVGTRPLRTPDTPLTIETDHNRRSRACLPDAAS